MAQDPEQEPISGSDSTSQAARNADEAAPSPVDGASAPLSYDSPAYYETLQTYEPAPERGMQGGYNIPPQNGYAPPAPPYQYGPPPGYTAPPQYQYGVPNYGYGVAAQQQSFVPPSSPLPLGEAIRQLPAQYLKVMTRPSYRTFAQEMGKASWNIVWVQLIIYTFVSTALGYLSIYLAGSTAGTDSAVAAATGLSLSAAAALQQSITIGSTYGQLLAIPVLTFVTAGLLLLLARAFGGQGKFLPQLYTILLIVVPLNTGGTLLILLLTLIPGIGSVFALLLIVARPVYALVLFGIALMPIHRLSGGRAAGAVLAFVGVAFLLLCALTIPFSILLAGSLKPG